MQKPQARSEHLVVEELGDELLVYDQLRDRAHCLGSAAARVWRACDGQSSATQLSAAVGLDEGTVVRALEELRDCELLDTPATPASGMTRRDLSFRAMKVGAAAASVPLIWSVTAGTPIAAATPTPEQCLFYTDTSCDACDVICGCCCCCQGKGGVNHTPSCKLCYPSGLCPSFTCPDRPPPAPGLGHCSTTPPDEPPGCTPAGVDFDCKSGAANQPCCTY